VVGTIEILAPQSCATGVAFSIAVSVSGATSSTFVTVQINQTHGLVPLWSSACTFQVGAAGTGAGAIHNVSLVGPSSQSVLVARGTSAAGDLFSPAVAGIRVL
jgi:hypothetical protein